MYYLEGIEKLSPTQASKLMRGHPVRVKKGMSHKIHMRPDQIKKLHSSHMKGKGTTLVLDPYQIDLNRETLGGALSLKKVGRMIKQGLQTGFDKYVKPQIRPALHSALDTGVSALTSYVPALAPMSHNIHELGTHAINTAGEHFGFGVRKHRRPGRPRKSTHTTVSGMGRKRKVGRPRKHRGGALYPPM